MGNAKNHPNKTTSPNNNNPDNPDNLSMDNLGMDNLSLGKANYSEAKSHKVNRAQQLVKLNLMEMFLKEQINISPHQSRHLAISDCLLSKDLKQAKIFINYIDAFLDVNSQPDVLDNKKLISNLNNQKKYIRHLLMQNIALKYTPRLTFYYNYNQNRTNKINLIFSKIKNDPKQP